MYQILVGFLSLALFVSCSSTPKKFTDKTGLPMTLNKNEQAYLALDSYRNVTLSDSGSYAAATAVFDNKAFIVILDRASKKVVSSVPMGDDFRVSRFYWLGDEKIIIQGGYVEGFLTGKRQFGVIFTLDRSGKNFKKIFPKKRPNYSGPMFRSVSILHDKLIEDRFLLVA
ncbi:MAG: hypothetical protein AAF203_10835, partial [Pseudomonadota bacterium]